MKMLFYFTIIMSLNFVFMKHPLSMGLILLIQTILSCLICSFYLNSYLFSYILFLIFIGGMLILFMYMSSIASNEKFFFSMKLFILNMFLLMLINWIGMIDHKMINFNDWMKTYNSYNLYMMSKLYIIPSGLMTLILVIYLLFTLVVVVNIVMMKMLALRSNM